jgi:hypothetical protein
MNCRKCVVPEQGLTESGNPLFVHHYATTSSLYGTNQTQICCCARVGSRSFDHLLPGSRIFGSLTSGAESPTARSLLCAHIVSR